MKDYSDTKFIFSFFFFFLQLHFQKSSAVFSFISLLNQDGHMLVHMPNGSGKGSLLFASCAYVPNEINFPLGMSVPKFRISTQRFPN